MNTLNGLTVLSVRLIFPWRGAWVADVVYTAPDVTTLVSAGPATLIIGDTTFSGVFDPRASGTFVNRAIARIVGGKGGWDTILPAQHFNNPSGALLSTLVYAATGALVGEVVTDPTPQSFGKDFARTSGAASRVFGDKDWFVDPLGTTYVASWPSSPLDPTAVIADYAPSEKRVTVYGDSPIFPGTTITDSRFNGATLIAREVEQIFDENGGRAEIWCADKATSRLQGALTNFVREAAQTAYLKTYKYRFVLPVGATQMALQSISGKGPDLNPIDQWTGLAGAQAKLLPGTEMVVGFAEGDPKQPYVVSFSPLNVPTEIDLGGGADFLTPSLWASGLATALVAMAAAMISSPMNVSGAGTALQSALGSLPPPATTITKAS